MCSRFYYVRVFEIPALRWTTYDAACFVVLIGPRTCQQQYRIAPTRRQSGTRQKGEMNLIGEFGTMKYGFVCAITVALMIGVYSHGASASSATVCDAYARNYATQTSRQGQIVGGAFVGSLIGLGIVAATGILGFATLAGSRPNMKISFGEVMVAVVGIGIVLRTRHPPGYRREGPSG